MFEDVYIRVASERLAEEAAAIAACGACPEVYIRADILPEFTARVIAAKRKVLAGFRSHTVHAPFMDVWPGAADAGVRQLSLETLRRAMGIAAELGSRLVVMHFNYDPVYYRVHVAEWLERAADFFATLLGERPGAAHRPGERRRANPLHRAAPHGEGRAAAPGPLLRLRPPPRLRPHPRRGMAVLPPAPRPHPFPPPRQPRRLRRPPGPRRAAPSTGRRPRRPSPGLPAPSPSPWSRSRTRARSVSAAYYRRHFLPGRE